MVQYKTYNFGFLESSEINRNIFYSLITGKCILLRHFNFKLLCSIGHDTLSFEDVLTCSGCLLNRRKSRYVKCL